MSEVRPPAFRRFAERLARRGRDVATTMSAELVSLAALSVIFPITTRGLGVERYGQYTVLYLIFGLAGLWVFASPFAATVQLILQLDYDSEELLRLGRRQMLIAAAPVALVGTAIAVGMLGRAVLVPAILVLGVEFVLTSLANLKMAVVFAEDGVVRATRIRMIQPVLRTAGVVALAIGSSVSILTLVGINVAAAAVLYLRASLAVQRRTRVEVPASRRPSGRDLLRYSSYYATSMSTNAVQNEGEKFVLAAARPAAEVGQYAAAYRVVSMTLIPVSAVVAAANRWFMVRDERSGAHSTRVARLAVPTAIYGIIAGIGIFAARDVVQWLAGSDFDEVALMSAWLCLLPLLHGLAELPPMGLLGLGRNRERMLMGFATSSVALVSYLVLVPPLGWRGAVIGTYVSEAAAIIAGWLLLVRCQRVADRRADISLVTSA